MGMFGHRYIRHKFTDVTTTRLVCDLSDDTIAVKDTDQMTYCPFCSKQLVDVAVEENW